MGLGKTVEALCVFDKKTLVVCPTSVLPNWRTELARFRPSLRVNVYHGPTRQLDDSAEVTLTTYAILLSKSSTAAGLGEGDTLFNSDPRRTFFYPSAFRPFDAALSFKGTLYNSAPTAPPQAGAAKGAVGPGVELRLPWADSEGGASADDGAAKAEEAAAEDFRLPSRVPDAAPVKASAWNGALGWTMTPAAYYENRYLDTAWNGVSDIDYARLYSLLSYKLAATLDGTASYGDYLSSSLSVTYSDQNQKRPYLYSDDSSPTAQATAPATAVRGRRMRRRSRPSSSCSSPAWRASRTSRARASAGPWCGCPRGSTRTGSCPS